MIEFIMKYNLIKMELEINYILLDYNYIDIEL